MPVNIKTYYLLNIIFYLILSVRSQSHAYDYGYATDVKRYTRKIQLKQGALQGVVVEPRINRALPPVEQFLGIPYAVPPTRELRFMPPGSAPSWFGTKIADSFGPVCPQKFPEKSKMAPEREEYFDKLVKHLILNQSEDCLYLNIYAPVQELEVPIPIYPVMVFIHGESYEWNSGNPYDGSVLATYGKVIVVTFNFRLGVFGFLRTGVEEAASSNFGLVDQAAALLWVQNNIAAFGGNPNLVTVFGHGTGAVCANLLMISPMVSREESKLLFKRAILMGGAALSDWAIATTPRHVTYQVASVLNCPPNEAELAGCLRTRHTNDILNASANTDYFVTRYGPITDARVIPNDLSHKMAKYNDLFKRFELMYGVTEIESAHLLGPVGMTHGFLEKERDQELARYLRVKCEYKPDLCITRTLEQYFGKRPGSSNNQAYDGGGNEKLLRDKLLDMLSDGRTVAPLVHMGRLHSVVNPQSYFYVFGHTTSSKEHARNKSVHGDELPYVFGVPLDGPKFHFSDKYTPQERLLSEVVMTYFSSFAYTGDPNVNRKTEFNNLNPIDWLKFDVEWPEFDVENEAYLYLELPPEVKYHYRNNEIRYWNEVLPDLLREGANGQNNQNRKTTFKPAKNPPPWLDPKPVSKGTANANNFHNFENFHKPLHVRPTEVYGTVQYNAKNSGPAKNRIEYGTIITEEPQTETRSGSGTNLLVIVGCLFLLVNIFVFAGLYYKCVRMKNKEKKRRVEYGVAAIEGIDEKLPKLADNASPLDGCNFMKMISKSTRSEDIYEAVKLSDDGSNTRFKLMRQMSSSTIDPHTKVRDWIAHEIVQRCSPRYLRRTRQQLADEHKAKQQNSEQSPKRDASAVDSNSTLGQSPTRPVSPEEKTASNESGECADQNKPSAIPLLKLVAVQEKKTAKVSVAIDATPTGRGISVLRQQPIELTRSMDYPNYKVDQEPQLRRSFTLDDVVNLSKDNDTLACSDANINLKVPTPKTRETIGGLRINHQHSASDPVDSNLSISAPKSLKSFGSPREVNVTSKDEAVDNVQPLTFEQQIQTIKRRNFPKVLPDFPHSNKDVLSSKRRSMPASSCLNLPIPEVSSFSQPTSPTGKLHSRLPPPAPPPRTTSTLARNLNVPRMCQTPTALVEEPQTPTEPEVTFNNLYIGPLIPAAKRSEKPTDVYKQNIQQIYDHLRPPKPAEKPTEKKEPKTVITADSDHPIKRSEPKVVIKPKIAKKSSELLNNSKVVGARVVARNSSEEKYDLGKIPGLIGPKIAGDQIANKIQRPSQIPTLSRPAVCATKKESSSSESTPSEESDTGTVVKRV